MWLAPAGFLADVLSQDSLEWRHCFTRPTDARPRMCWHAGQQLPVFSRNDMTMKTETRDQEIDEAACMLHNVGATLAGNTQEGDVEWLARWLFGSSNFGMDSGDTFQWSISNDEFEKLGLLPDRLWTGRRWETLEPDESETWKKLARLCLYALPHVAERIGHRFMEQAKALRIVQRTRIMEDEHSTSNHAHQPEASK